MTVSEIVSVICKLILPRYILRYYGSAYNGISSSAAQFLSIITILNLGITASTRVALYSSIAKDDMEETSSILRANEKHMRKVGSLLLVYLLALTFVYPLVVKTDFPYFDVALLVFAGGITTFAELFFGVTYQTFLSASQRAYITQLFSIAATIVSTALSVFLIKAGYSIQVVKLAAASVYFIKQPIFNWIIPRKYGIDRKAPPHPEALSRRRDATAHSVANIVHNKTDIIVLTLFCDVKLVSVYTIYHMIMNMLDRTKQILTTGTEPVFGNMWAKGETDKIRKALSGFEFVMTAFISVVIPTTLVLLLPFVSLYTKVVHDIQYMQPVYAVVITAAFAFSPLRAPNVTLTRGAGFYKETKRGAYMEAGINIVLSVVLVQFFGIVGVAVGTLAANMFRTIQYMLFVDRKIVPRGMKVPLLKMLWAFMNIAIMTLLLNPLAEQYAKAGWKAWVLCGFASVLITSAFTLLSSLLFYRSDLKDAWGVLQNMIKKR